MISFKMNGIEVEADEGMTLLDAAESVGIDIPTMCHHKDLSDFGVCRLCVVELIKRNRSKIVASCIYPVEEGIEVLTESEPVVKHRKMILELLLSRWPRVDKDLLKRYGVERSRIDENTTFCILCGLCVRYCAEVKGENVLGFVGRGTQRQVVFYPDLAEKACPTCGDGEMECLKVCPTGIIPSDLVAPNILDKRPLVFPVQLRDDDNLRAVSEHVGDVD